MLSISARGNATSAETYYEHLATGKQGGIEDYYAVDAPGQWAGSGAEALELAGEVQEGQFMALAQGYLPSSGQPACQNAGDESHRAGWDLTFSAPKSVSVAWGLGDHETRKVIEDAHDAAVAGALAFAERHAAYSRTGHAGADQVRAQLIVSAYRHGTSREQDPQLHTHAFVHNVCLRPDGSTGTIESRNLFIWRRAIGEGYDTELAHQLRLRGFNVERDGDSFRIADIDPAAERIFSKRREQIEAVLEERGATGAKAAEIATLDTRRAKQEVSPAAIAERWRSEIGLERHQNLVLSRIERVAEEAKSAAPEILTDPIRAKLTEHQSTFTAAQACVEVMKATRCKAGIDFGEERTREFLAHDTGVERLTRASIHAKVGARFTTPEMRALEGEMVARAEKMAEKLGHRVAAEATAEAITNNGALSDEQRRMVRHIAHDSGDVATVQGVAGSGKSYALRAAREAWEAAGYEVTGLAVSGKAARALEEGSGIESRVSADVISPLFAGLRCPLDQSGPSLAFHGNPGGLDAQPRGVADDA